MPSSGGNLIASSFSINPFTHAFTHRSCDSSRRLIGLQLVQGLERATRRMLPHSTAGCLHQSPLKDLAIHTCHHILALFLGITTWSLMASATHITTRVKCTSAQNICHLSLFPDYLSILSPAWWLWLFQYVYLGKGDILVHNHTAKSTSYRYWPVT